MMMNILGANLLEKRSKPRNMNDTEEWIKKVDTAQEPWYGGLLPRLVTVHDHVLPCSINEYHSLVERQGCRTFLTQSLARLPLWEDEVDASVLREFAFSLLPCESIPAPDLVLHRLVDLFTDYHRTPAIGEAVELDLFEDCAHLKGKYECTYFGQLFLPAYLWNWDLGGELGVCAVLEAIPFTKREIASALKDPRPMHVIAEELDVLNLMRGLQ